MKKKLRNQPEEKKLKSLGLIKVNYDNDCDDDFGMYWSTQLIFKDGSERHYEYHKPEQFYGVFGLVFINNEYHLLSEDDGNFWTHSILTVEEIDQFYDLVTKLNDEVVYLSNYKVNLTKKIKEYQIEGVFSYKITERGKHAPLLSIDIKDKELSFDMNWLPSLLDTLDIKEYLVVTKKDDINKKLLNQLQKRIKQEGSELAKLDKTGFRYQTKKRLITDLKNRINYLQNKRYYFTLTLGDSSYDGHCMTDQYILKSNYPVEKLIDIYIETRARKGNSLDSDDSYFKIHHLWKDKSLFTDDNLISDCMMRHLNIDINKYRKHLDLADDNTSWQVYYHLNYRDAFVEMLIDFIVNNNPQLDIELELVELKDFGHQQWLRFRKGKSQEKIGYFGYGLFYI